VHTPHKRTQVRTRTHQQTKSQESEICSTLEDAGYSSSPMYYLPQVLHYITNLLLEASCTPILGLFYCYTASLTFGGEMLKVRQYIHANAESPPIHTRTRGRFQAVKPRHKKPKARRNVGAPLAHAEQDLHV
jgi:hypothetical protein